MLPLDAQSVKLLRVGRGQRCDTVSRTELSAGILLGLIDEQDLDLVSKAVFGLLAGDGRPRADRSDDRLA
jgi:hypothetical protein